MSSPTLYLFGGPNGSGKTTYARAFLTSQFEHPLRFLNADEMARGLSPLSPESVALKAGKLLLREIDECIAAGTSFGLESTLSGSAQVRILQRAKARGYLVELHFFALPSPELSIARIAQRVEKGGHHVPDDDVMRRYPRSLGNLARIYEPLSDHCFRWNNVAVPAALEPAQSRTVDAFSEPATAAARVMASDLLAEQKRWRLPLLTWRGGALSELT
ncbi:zeta toxin family protein [Luteolibacter sp. GHJ8]|uniref:Zeta toxin family protein n=1 Tax=Luteolibacter rhizosphaerae TaxID=2989719 RepID=A0ABT3G7K8_9BACT|nr:zeta toxin family protein [Luteolibacter rhizosphaerae]MCW1915833.1 zeta toxin family protein [Luteolibacter rhizosphaerae]